MRSSHSTSLPIRFRSVLGSASRNARASVDIDKRHRSSPNGARGAQRCLSEADARDLVEGTLCTQRWRTVQEHLAQCRPCRRWISELARDLRPPSSATVPSTGADLPDALQLDPPSAFGRYRVHRQIGEGGMGRVFEAYDPQLKRRVAIKVVRDASTHKGRLRLWREAQVLARLSHPNIVEVHDLGTLGDELFIAMELVAGESLAHWLQPQRRPSAVLDAFRQAGAGLAAAHRAGVVHRDFKPSNVMVDPAGRVRVLDFGLACAPEPSLNDSAVPPTFPGPDPMLTAGRAGTPAYMAPEQLRGQPADARSDQFSFCVSLFEGLYGRRPFRGRSISELRRAIKRRDVEESDSGVVPQRVRKAMLRGLRAEPDERWPTMEALLERLHGPTSQLRWWGLAGAIVAAALVLPQLPSTPDTAEAAEPELPNDVRAPESLALEVERIQTLRNEGKFARAIEYADALEPRVVESGDRRLLARFHYQRGIAALSHGLPARDDFAAAYELDEGESSVAAALQLAVIAAEAGRPDDALRWLGEAEAGVVRADAPDGLALDLAVASGQTYETLGDLESARRGYEEALRLARDTLPPMSPEIATRLDDYGQALRQLGDIEGALAAHEESRRHYEATVGPDHPWTAASIEKAGNALSTAGRHREAVALYRRSLSIRERALGPEHNEVLASLTNLGSVLLAIGDVDEGAQMLERSMRIEESRGELGQNSIATIHGLANARLLQQRPEEAARLFSRAATIVQEGWGPHHPIHGSF